MAAAPTISCLIPVYNGERYLELALDSVLGQSFGDFELVAVDDGSSDSSNAILKRYAATDSRIRIIEKPNGGIVSALNLGLEHCRGQYVARMDCDDIATPERFEIQMEVFDKHTDAVAVGGLIQLIDGEGQGMSAPGSPSRVSRTRLDVFPPVVANVQHSAGTFLKQAMDTVGGYRSNFPHAEDYDLYLRLAEHGRFYNPGKLVLYYRVHPGSLSMKNLEWQETSAVLAELSAYARRSRMEDPGDAEEPLGLDEYASRLGALCPKDTIRRYIDFRLWRRLMGARDPDAAAFQRRVLNGLLDPRCYRRPMDRKLNRRITLSLGRKLLRTLRYEPVRLLGRRKPMKLAK
ncbi:MAG: glycosyltransferase [Aurantimonas endophytica]|uniref:glycosyltransferase family 2 protein n=1 Tax=Aurantimonas endophytica TaxID=1522175 RepID=UPI0030017E6D